MNEKNGIVTGSIGGLYTVMTDEKSIISCKPRGRFRYEKMRLLPGDRVKVGYSDDNTPVIDSIFERKNSMLRPPLANLDILFCVASVVSPKIDMTTFDKLIISAEKKVIEPVVIISKSDLSVGESEELAESYKKCGFTVFCLSGEKNENVAQFKKFLYTVTNKICAFSGASGVGKSTLINVMFGKLDLQVGELSSKVMRGKQTTRQCSLYPFSQLLSDENAGGFLADTPGFSMLDFMNFDFCNADELPELFREFKPYLGKCRYTKCRHLKEDGCAVLAAVKNGIIPESRHCSYIRIYNEVKDKHPWDDKSISRK